MPCTAIVMPGGASAMLSSAIVMPDSGTVEHDIAVVEHDGGTVGHDFTGDGHNIGNVVVDSDGAEDDGGGVGQFSNFIQRLSKCEPLKIPPDPFAHTVNGILNTKAPAFHR